MLLCAALLMRFIVLNFKIRFCRPLFCSSRISKALVTQTADMTFNLINKQNAATSQVYYVSFRYSPGRARPAALLSPSSDGKPETTTAVVVAPDDGHEDALYMLSCI
jgi:hypothetical protein